MNQAVVRSTQRRQPNAQRRSSQSHDKIIRVTLSLLKHRRYSALTVDAIASKAGVGKATVYRWWPSKGALVAEALASTLVVEDPPQTEDLRADLVVAVGISIKNYLQSPGADLLHALASDISGDPDLLRSFLEAFILPRRAAVVELIRRGIAAGLIPDDCDPDLVMDMWAGAIFYRGLFQHVPIEDDLAADLVDAVFGHSMMHRKLDSKA